MHHVDLALWLRAGLVAVCTTSEELFSATTQVSDNRHNNVLLQGHAKSLLQQSCKLQLQEAEAVQIALQRDRNYAPACSMHMVSEAMESQSGNLSHVVHYAAGTAEIQLQK